MPLNTHRPSGPPRVALATFYDPVSLGVRTLQAVLDRAGYPTDLIFFRERLDAARPLPSEREYALFLDLVGELRPLLLGLSFRSFGFKIAERLTREVRERYGTFVVWGGTHPTLAPADCAAVADAVCVGEGEGALLDLVRALETGSDPSAIPNLWLRNNGELRANPIRPLVQELDALPFPLLGDAGKYVLEDDRLENHDPYYGPRPRGQYFLAASRGCPYRCDYCCNSAFHRLYHGAGPYVRKRSPENVLAELKRAKAHLDLHYVGFMDEVFSLDKAWTLEICRGYRERIGLPFKCEVHPQTLDDELVQGMRQAGLAYAVVGVQSGSARLRRELYHRHMDNGEILRAARLFRRHRVIPYYDFILDNPYETPADLEATVSLVLDLPRPFNLELLSLTFFPETEITRRALADGVITPDQVEGRDQKTLTGLVYTLGRSINDSHRRAGILLALAMLKFDWRGLFIGSVAARYGSGFHLLPPALVRWISRRPRFQNSPVQFYRSVQKWIEAANAALAPLRSLRGWAARLLRGR